MHYLEIVVLGITTNEKRASSGVVARLQKCRCRASNKNNKKSSQKVSMNKKKMHCSNEKDSYVPCGLVFKRFFPSSYFFCARESHSSCHLMESFPAVCTTLNISFKSPTNHQNTQCFLHKCQNNSLF